MEMIRLPSLLTVAFLFLSCATGPLVIPEDMTPAELIQRGQEASDRNKYPAALHYYETIIERFPFEIDYVIAAEYEIAFIHYKQKKYDISKIEFTDILERYNIPDEELLPQQFKILSLKIMERITEIENLRRKRS
jgi:outer membrane protein assembly factor BamD (BamD/ComL family)